MSVSLPELASLRLLADVARLGSIGAAGRAAGISQQSASERLRSMEAQTGLVLVQRSARGAMLTAEGRLLVEWSADLLRRGDEIETALTTLRRAHRTQLHVHASMTTAEYLLPGWLVELRRASPTVTVSMQATNSEAVLAAVREGRADLGFIEGPADVSGLRTRVVGHDELVLVAAPDDPWVRRRMLTPRQLAGRALTSREPGSGTRLVVERALQRALADTAPAEPEAELTTNTAVRAAVRAGSAPAFLSLRAVERDVEVGVLVRLEVRGLDLRRAFTAVWAGGAALPPGPARDLLAIASRRTG
ncbi:MAG: LysR substrate-binding domain-containing protein [Nocardioides sp.]|uniref:LysR substrate-binding domain-containing protein n=1 Tax=Nocardioides sp. TaxID=35761 RepID=UPI0039E47FDF